MKNAKNRENSGDVGKNCSVKILLPDNHPPCASPAPKGAGAQAMPLYYLKRIHR